MWGGAWGNVDNWHLDTLELMIINLMLETQHRIPYLQFPGNLVRELWSCSHLSCTSVVLSRGPFCPLGDIWPSLETFLAVTPRGEVSAVSCGWRPGCCSAS